MSLLTSFWQSEACGQTVLPDRSVLIGHKLVENVKIKNSNATFWVIFKQFFCLVLAQNFVVFKIILTSKDFRPSIYWEKTHSFSCQIRFGLEIVLPPNCLPIIGNNPGNCTAFPVIFKVIYQNWEFKIIFLQCAKNHHHLLKKEDESSKIGRWLFSALIFNQLHFIVGLAPKKYSHRPFWNDFWGVVKKQDLQKWLINGLDSHLGISMFNTT